MALAIWSYPHQKEFTAVNSELQHHVSFNAKLLQGSFLITPYHHQQEGVYSISTAESIKLEKTHDWLKVNLPDLKAYQELAVLPDYKSQIDFALFEFDTDDKFEKVVFSRCKDHTYGGFNYNWLDQLRSAYPSAFISLLSDEKLGTWVTASPELYLKRHKDLLTSFSLAGTKYGRNSQLGKKEQEEQRIVTNFIVKAFETTGLDVSVKNGVEHKAGNLTHLLTVVEGSIGKKTFDLQMLILGLHPTPAVCGFPRSWAKDFINFEGYKRELFTGFLGECIDENNFELFVNLRCAQVFDSHIRFYAGAGITRDSNPEKEFMETEAKMGVLQSVLLSHQ